MSDNNVFARKEIASKLMTLTNDIRKLKSENIAINNECGSCNFWMNKNRCDREKSGHKVVCSELKCDKFQMHRGSTLLINQNNVKIKAIEKELGL